jgi:hypothetical protein
VGRLADEHRARNSDELGVGAAVSQAKDLVADGPPGSRDILAGDLLGLAVDFDDDAAELDAEDGACLRRNWVLAARAARG